MSKQKEIDFVIPLFKENWNTRAVVEGLSFHYKPRFIHIITPSNSAKSLEENSKNWDISPLKIHEEESFFSQKNGLTKDEICAEIDLGQSLYTPGWFYQQLLKLGANEGIEDLNEWYMVWDSDLLPVATWDIFSEKNGKINHNFALLQHKNWGNNSIVSKWEIWIESLLGVKPFTNEEGTFVPHHMWFKQEHLTSFKRQINEYYQSEESWLLLMMRSANEFGTFSEYWSYVSWVAAKAPEDLSFYPYSQYGETTERFFDDGTGLFSQKLKQSQPDKFNSDSCNFSPSYQEITSFINDEYGLDKLPSSLSFESSPRHMKKDKKNMHIEELRSRWNMRKDF